MIYSFIGVMAIMCVYITVYYLLSFRTYFAQGITMETLKNSTFLKQITFYAFLIILAIAISSITIVQDIVLGKFTTTRKRNIIIWCRICRCNSKKMGIYYFLYIYRNLCTKSFKKSQKR